MSPSPDPALAAIPRARFAALLGLQAQARQLRLRTHGKVLATRSGGHSSRFRGRGMAFAESRRYQPGDDVRHMDWRLTARRGTPHVKLFEEDREQPLRLLVDQGPGMQFGTRVTFKSILAAQLAALLGWAAVAAGDRVGGLVFDADGRSDTPPRAQTRGLLPVLRALSDGAKTQPAGFGGVLAALDWLQPRLERGERLVLISDFRDLDADGQQSLRRCLRRHEVLALWVQDPLELAPPVRGRYPIFDGSRHGLLDTADPAQRARLAQAWNAREEALTALAAGPGLHLLAVRTDEDPAQALRRGLTPPGARA